MAMAPTGLTTVAWIYIAIHLACAAAIASVGMAWVQARRKRGRSES
jgi:hypothetical protein